MTSALDLLTTAWQILTGHPIAISLGFAVFWLLWNKFQPGLVSIPGPTAAAYTKFWRVYNVFSGSAHLDAIALHKKHGNLVRIAPNHVSVADPRWIPVFYGTKEDYTKVKLVNQACLLPRTDNIIRVVSIQYKLSPGRSSRR